MLTTDDIKIRYGQDSVLIFKGTEPFEEVHQGVPQGALIMNGDGNVLCYECNTYFKSVGQHLPVHGIKASEYKEKYGLNSNAPLCNKDVSRSASKGGTNTWAKEGNRDKILITLRQPGSRHNNKGRKFRTQYKNEKNTCDEQLKARMELLVARFGPNVSKRQAKEADSALMNLVCWRYGSWNNWKEMLGIEQTPVGWKTKEDAEVMYDLRNYVKTYERLPWVSTHGQSRKTRDAFPHSADTYLARFGSFRRTYLECGIVSHGKGGATILM